MIASVKFMQPNSSDEIFVSVKSFNEGLFEPAKVKFIASSGKEYDAVYNNDKKGWTINLLGSNDNDGYSLYVVHQTGGDYATLAKLSVYSYLPKTVKLKLVPVNGFSNGFTAQAVTAELNKIYGKVGITCQVEITTPFNYEPLAGKALDVTGSGLLSVFTEDMRLLNKAYIAENPNETGAVLFIVEKATEDVVGDMPRGKQFGYLFGGASAQTIAHEIGHGLFKLEHPFSRAATANSFAKGDLRDNLMEYYGGTSLVKLQWDAIHHPGTVIGIFEQDEDAMLIKYKNNIVFTWKYLNTPRLLAAKKELKYIAEGGYEEQGKERTSFFLLEDGKTIVARYQDPNHIAEQVFKYEIRLDGDQKWYELDIYSLTDDCLSCDLTRIWSSISMTMARIYPPVFLVENGYVIMSGHDFQVEESSKVEAGVWIVIGVAGGKIFKGVGYLLNKTYHGSKFIVNNTSKLFKIVKGNKGAKVVELSADEIAQIVTKSGQSVEVLEKYKVAIWNKIKVIAKDESLPNRIKKSFLDNYYYTAEMLENVIVYRRFGGGDTQAKLFGGFASTEAVLSRSQLAVLKKWSTMQYEVELLVQKGARVNLGKVAPQLGYRGGADQILLPLGYPESWVKSIKDLKTGIVYTLDEFKKAFPSQIK